MGDQNNTTPGQHDNPIAFQIAKLRLEEGDVLVVKLHGLVPPERQKHFGLMVKEFLPPNIKFVVIDSTIDFAVLTKAQIDARTELTGTKGKA